MVEHARHTIEGEELSEVVVVALVSGRVDDGDILCRLIERERFRGGSNSFVEGKGIYAITGRK